MNKILKDQIQNTVFDEKGDYRDMYNSFEAIVRLGVELAGDSREITIDSQCKIMIEVLEEAVKRFS